MNTSARRSTKERRDDRHRHHPDDRRRAHEETRDVLSREEYDREEYDRLERDHENGNGDRNVLPCERERHPGGAEHIFALLEQAGHRLTEPRIELIRAVSAQAQRPFTGEDLYEELRDTGLGRATVFRTLKLLLDLNVLSRLHMEDGCQQYILAPADGSQGENHHDRLICRICGRVAYLDQCPMEDAIAGIAKRSGYSVETHHLDIIGLCGDCHLGQ